MRLKFEATVTANSFLFFIFSLAPSFKRHFPLFCHIRSYYYSNYLILNIFFNVVFLDYLNVMILFLKSTYPHFIAFSIQYVFLFFFIFPSYLFPEYQRSYFLQFSLCSRTVLCLVILTKLTEEACRLCHYCLLPKTVCTKLNL